jgi:hypothetical protein
MQMVMEMEQYPVQIQNLNLLIAFHCMELHAIKGGNMTKIDPEEYRRSFIESSVFPNRAEDIHNKAYEIANDNRKFEISNYWKRANYYWLFQASVYAGYFYSVRCVRD